MQNGWVKLHRKILDNQTLKHDNTAYIVFTKLLLTVDKETGEYDIGRFQLGELTNFKPITAYKALKRLQNAKMVTLSSNNKYTRIHICNWRKYQQTVNTASNNKVTTKEQQSNTKQEIRIENNINTTKVVFGSSAINEIFEYWHAVVGYEIVGQRQANRRAASNLIKKHGVGGTQRLIKGVAIASTDRYAPRIADFTELQKDYNRLIAWGKKQTSKVVVIE